MSGETSLTRLLSEMSPELDPLSYVFATTDTPKNFEHLDAIMRFTEGEGETLILKSEDVRGEDIICSGEYARITLSVHSSLEAVGFLAAICTALAKQGISTNAVAAYYHDHIFVPLERAEEAMDVLSNLTKSGNSVDG